MAIDSILKEKDPQLAEFLELWSSKYNRSYDFSISSEQANFYEGVLEMARHIAASGSGAILNITTNTSGVGGLTIANY